MADNYYLITGKFPGRPCKFKSAQELWDKAVEYFEWVDTHPIITKDFRGKDAKKVAFEHQRPYTITGFCLFANTTRETLNSYSKKDGFTDVVCAIREICYSQKFDGAAAGIFQHNIIARDLGLAEKTDHTTGGEPIRPIIQFTEDDNDNKDGGDG